MIIIPILIVITIMIMMLAVLAVLSGRRLPPASLRRSGVHGPKNPKPRTRS